ncbi:GGDEF domain-containing protein [Pseudoalteromonas tetraodonis GFC]|uniref:GGDEF domain-containing protein n=1 Tax=Pseudoalteromonas tetraodonis GFC TaxID=1315271 RepID=A0AA37W3K8_9GAMM|nr:GGDEF domain-containing protein [Pseudoalteromonas tetraodonis]ATD05316.1 hypothetical protein PTET_b0693 [Pseudoalteromonas tetraodonis]GEN38304.1 GGDEF domain-containing protein [Pseudoalteromonas tetraodonis GFC]GLQ04369.1 GGDEF domain-containing protein [Pseudoalteromonas tetraodonis GFC]
MPLQRLLILFISLALSEAIIMMLLASFVTKYTGIWFSVILDVSLISFIAIITIHYLFNDSDFVKNQQSRTEFLTFKIAMIVFTIEALVMFAFNFDEFVLQQWQVIAIDSLILSSLSVPIIYFSIIKPAFLPLQEQNSQKLNTTIFTSLLTYFCSAIILYIALYMFYENQIQTRIGSVIQKEKNELKQAKYSFLQQLNHASRDLLILKNNHHFKEQRFFSNENKTLLEQDYFNFITIKNYYTQIRILSLKGQELIRVQRENNSTVIVPPDKLQDKSDRYYYKRGIKLSPDDIFISPLDLNIENGQIERPLKPMIRLGSVLVDKNNEKIGLLIINLGGVHLLSQLENISKSSLGDIMLFNEESYWLFGDVQKQWAFMFANKPQQRFQDIHPDIWQAMETKTNGIIEKDNNIYIFEHMTLLDQVPTLDNPRNSNGKWPKWKLVNKVPLSLIENEFSSLKKLIVLLYLGVMLLMIFVIYTFANHTIARREYEAKVESYAFVDSLTGLYNRRIFLDKLDKELNKAQFNESPLVLMYLDLDYFKPINDELGHGAGDEALKEVATRIKSCLRKHDIIARIGGDEFAAILPQLNDKDVISEIAQRIITNISKPFILFDQKRTLGISIGITITNGQAHTSLEVKTHADQALYEAKNSGRNCYRFSKETR